MQAAERQGWRAQPGWTRLDVEPSGGVDVVPRVGGKPILPKSPEESTAQVKSLLGLWHPDPQLPLRDRLKAWKMRAAVVAAQSGHPVQKVDYEAMLLDMLEAVEILYGGIIDAMFEEDPDTSNKP